MKSKKKRLRNKFKKNVLALEKKTTTVEYLKKYSVRTLDWYLFVIVKRSLSIVLFLSPFQSFRMIYKSTVYIYL